MELEDRKTLLKLARDTIENSFKNQDPDINNVLHLRNEQGVFVTLHKNSDLRGCIGFPEPILPLYQAVIEAAKSAAFQDPRFPRVTKDELRNIKIELSILSVPIEINVDDYSEYNKEIDIGVDGLIIRSHLGSGLLLPQVAVEQNWTVSQFLNALCQKANLPFSAWHDLNNKIYKFQAEVFTEK